MITTGMIASVLVLPLVGLLFFRLYENQILRQTEGELIAQAAMLSAVYAREIEAKPEAFPIGPPRPPQDPAIVVDERYTPILPSLDLAAAPILPPRPFAKAAPAAPHPEAVEIGARLASITAETQRTTLAGFRLLNAQGVVIAGRDDVGGSYAHLSEVRSAMAGNFSVVLRLRNQDAPPPPLDSISRGASIRIFLAMPVFVRERLRGVVYVTRTPDNILRHLYREREQVALAALLALTAAAAIGAVFVRIISRPMRDLVRRSEAIGRGDREAIGGLPHYGTRELAGLANGFMNMARQLFDRSDYLRTFASHVSHELKTPLTSIRGAAELMLDPAMEEAQRKKFLVNVLSDSERMSALLDRLRELARAENPDIGGATTLEEAIEPLRERFPDLNIRTKVGLPASGLVEPGDAPAQGGVRMPLSQENAAIVFGHLIDNARRHGASRIDIDVQPELLRLKIRVADNGAGISPGNRARVFDAFFTTRRAEGGAGMGLHIVRSMLRAHGGDIRLAPSHGGAEREQAGASFELWLPANIEPARRRLRLAPFMEILELSVRALRRSGSRHAKSTYRPAGGSAQAGDSAGNNSARTDASRL
jgi:signal transduction histidine kinase